MSARRSRPRRGQTSKTSISPSLYLLSAPRLSSRLDVLDYQGRRWALAPFPALSWTFGLIPLCLLQIRHLVEGQCSRKLDTYVPLFGNHLHSATFIYLLSSFQTPDVSGGQLRMPSEFVGSKLHHGLPWLGGLIGALLRRRCDGMVPGTGGLFFLVFLRFAFRRW
jgi:hypothetical protein